MCRLLRMSLLCLLLLFMFCTSVSFASINYNGFTEFNYNGNRYDFLNYIFEKVFGEDFDEFGVNCQINGVSHNSSGTDTSYTRYINFSNIAFDTSYTSMYVLITRSTNYKFINSDYNVIEFRFSKSNFSSDYYGTFSFRINTNGTYGMVNGTNNNSGISIYAPTLNNTNKGAFLYSSNKWYYRTGQLIAFPTNNLKYTSYKTSTMLINMSGDNFAFNKADYNITDSIDIGYLINIQYFDNIKGYLSVYSGTSNIDNANYWDTIASFTYVKDIGTYSNRLSFNKNTGVVTISPNLLQYNHGYAIYFEASNNNGNSDYNETEAVWYYVVPTGSTGTSGTINTENPTGVDFDFINSIEYLNQTSSGNTQFIINSSLSQFFSGDIGYVAPSDNQTHYGFLHQMFVDLIDLLQVNSTTSSITINVHGYNNTFYAADFITPNNSIKTFAQLFLVVGCFFLLYQQFMGIYFALLTLDVRTFVRSQDVDFTFFM